MREPYKAVLAKWNAVASRIGRERFLNLPVLGSRWILLLAAAYATWWFLSTVPSRLTYLGEIEWMEGGILGHVLRVTEGKPIYVAPSPEFTPYIYTPFYYWFCAALSSIFGLSVHLLRAVSFACFIGTCALIVLFTWRKSGRIVPGLIGAGLFAATFRLGGAWFDIARGDSMVVMWILLAATMLFCFESRRTAIAAGVIFAVAFLTKQSALLPLASVVAWALITRKRRLLWFAGTSSALVAASWGLLHLATDGWFTFYIVHVPAGHPLLEDWKWLFWTNDFFGVLIVAALLLIYECGASLVPEKGKFLASTGFTLFVLGAVGQVWSSRFHMGMYDNVLMPLHALFGLGVALALGRLMVNSRRSLEFACHVVLIGTLFRLEYKPEEQVPQEAHLQQRERFFKEVLKLPKDTWIAFHSVPAIQAGLPPRAHWMALVDVDRAGGDASRQIQKAVHDWLKRRPVSAIVWSIRDSSDAWFRKEMVRYYRRARALPGPPPLTGWGQRATEVWVPRAEGYENEPDVRHHQPRRRRREN